MAALVPSALPARRHSDEPAAIRADPGVVAASARRRRAGDQCRGGTAQRRGATFGLLAVGALLVAVSWSSTDVPTATVLPRSAFRPGPLKWMYVTIGLLMAATMVDMYVPLFAQHLAGMVPAAAGFFGAVLAVGWTRRRSRAHRPSRTRTIVRLVAVAPW